jgi:ubiquinone/menaquinone biosynthesis C-methylase UbiE
MSFDLLAPHYRWMEWVLAGGKLQRCRTAFLASVPAPRRALLLGEGNGRFLVELLRMHPGVDVVCVDSSRKMLECARSRLQRSGLDGNSVEFVQANILEWSTKAGQFDLIVSHFFLDCFRPEQLLVIMERLSAVAAPDAQWLLADFREPAAGWAKWRARLILQAMYLYFRRFTKLPAARLTAPDQLLEQHGFVLNQRRLFEWGLLHSDWWVNRGRAG